MNGHKEPANQLKYQKYISNNKLASLNGSHVSSHTVHNILVQLVCSSSKEPPDPNPLHDRLEHQL